MRGSKLGIWVMGVLFVAAGLAPTVAVGQEPLDRENCFWHVRLGALSVDAADLGREARVSRDLYVRCMLDNFCCLQTDAAGTLVSHYQGAPKPGTIWGIDYEPTLVSILPLVPELARQGLLFTLDRNRAPRRGDGRDRCGRTARKWRRAGRPVCRARNPRPPGAHYRRRTPR